MKEAVINEIILEMQSKVDNGQLIELKSALNLQISCKIWAFAV